MGVVGMGGGRFAASDSAEADITPPPSPLDDMPTDAKLPREFRSEIAHHLATAMDLDPRCVREVTAMGEGAKLALRGARGATVIEDDHDDSLDYAAGPDDAFGGDLYDDGLVVQDAVATAMPESFDSTPDVSDMVNSSGWA